MALVFAILLFLLLAGASVIVFRRLLSPATVTQCELDWLEKFDSGRYAPMARLLADPDYSFLASQPGCERSLTRRLRAERRRVFRQYLRCLEADFHRLYHCGRLLLAMKDHDSSELASRLLRARVAFAYSVTRVELALLLHSFGLARVDAAPLLRFLEALRAELLQSPAVQAALA